MSEPITTASAVKSAIESIASVWARGALLLWSCAVAALAAFLVLVVAERLNVGGAAHLNKEYGIYLLLVAVVGGVFAIFKTYMERANRPLSLIADEQRSHWGQSKQPSGEIFTAISLDFQATNLSDGDLKLADNIRLLWPWVPRRKILQTVLFVEHPKGNTHGHYPILAHRSSHCSAHITIDQPIGRPKRDMRVTIKIQDHARRWHTLKFRRVRSF